MRASRVAAGLVACQNRFELVGWFSDALRPEVLALAWVTLVLATTHEPTSLHPVLSWFVFWAKALVLVIAVTLIAALHARYRIDQAVRYFVGMLAISMAAVALAAYGY